MDWEAADRVQKNANGEFRALINGEWIPVAKAQKNASGEFRVMRSEQVTPDTPKSERSFVGSLGRQLGLTARHGIEGVGNALALPGHLVDAASVSLGGEPVFRSGTAISGLADKLGLPRPESPEEMFAGDVSRTMAGVGGLGKVSGVLQAASQSPVARNVLSQMAGNQGLAQAGAAGAGVGQAVARENELGPWGTLGATLAGSMVAPTAAIGAQAAYRGAGHLVDTLGAGLGLKAPVDRLASIAARKIAGDDAEQIVGALANRSARVKGADPTVAEAIAEANIGKPGRFGSDTVALEHALSRQSGFGDILRSKYDATQRALERPVEGMAGGANAQQRASSMAAATNRRAAITSPMREQALDKANIGGVDPAKIRDYIDDLISKPGDRISTTNKQVLMAVRDKIDEATGLESGKYGGRINARDLYTIRKQDIGDIVAKLTKDSDAATKRHAADLVASVKGQVDDAIEAAGGTGWKDYLHRFMELSRGMDRAKVSEAVLERMKSPTGKASPSQLMNVMGKGEEAMLKRSTGQPRYETIEEVLTPQQAKFLRNVESVYARQAKSKQMASDVMGADVGSLADVPKLPTLLHRPMMAVNFALRTIGKDASTPIARRLAEAAKNPEEYIKLLMKPKSDQLSEAAWQHFNKGMMAATVAETE